MGRIDYSRGMPHLADFSRRRVAARGMPIIISPAHREEFVEQLLQVNPRIKVEL